MDDLTNTNYYVDKYIEGYNSTQYHYTHNLNLLITTTYTLDYAKCALIRIIMEYLCSSGLQIFAI